MLNEQSLVRAFKTLIVDKLAKIVDLIIVGSTLEPATALKLGGVKIGSGINVTEDGTISSNSAWTEVCYKQSNAPQIDLTNVNEIYIILYSSSKANSSMPVIFPTPLLKRNLLKTEYVHVDIADNAYVYFKMDYNETTNKVTPSVIGTSSGLSYSWCIYTR